MYKKINFKIARIYAFIVITGIVGWVIYWMSIPLDSDPSAAKYGQTKSMLWLCGGAIDSWKKDHGRLPTTAEGFEVLGLRTNQPLDGWKQAIIYKDRELNSEHHFLLYSIGPNGIDEQGRGDDINFEPEMIKSNGKN